MLRPPKMVRPPKIAHLTLDNWNRGRVSILDENRGLLNGLDESINIQITQNGAVAPRPGLVEYGIQPTGKVLGWAEATRVVDGEPINYLTTVEQVSDTVAKVKYSLDGGAWTTVDGIDYPVNRRHYFCQTDQKVLITNGETKTNYLDLKDMSLERFIKLNPPTNLGITQTGLTSGGIVLRYAITAQNRGETEPVYFPVQKVNLERREWESGQQQIKLTWNKVPNAERYLIYVGSEQGKEQYITYVADDGSPTYTFTDTGVIYPQPRTVPPDTNTTEGVVATRATNVSGVVYMTGDKSNPYRIYFDGGTPQTALNFSWFGGGWIDIAPGGKDIPNVVIPFRTGKADPVPTVMGRRSNGQGTMKHLVDQVVDVAGTPTTVMTVQEANGQEGTDAPDAVIIYRSDVYYLSRDGFKKTGTKPEIQSILGTDTISETIAPDVLKLNSKNLDKSVGIAMEGKMLYSLPVASTENSEIWMNDISRGGIWLFPWTIPAKGLLQYGDSVGVAHNLALVNDKIMEFKDTLRSVDGNKPFETVIKTARVYFSKEKHFAQVEDVILEFIDPQGEINVELVGWTRKGKSKILRARKVFSQRSKRVGWGDKFRFQKLSDLGWGKPRSVPPITERNTETIKFKPKTAFKWITVKVWTKKAVKYQLNDISVRFVPIGFIPEKER